MKMLKTGINKKTAVKWLQYIAVAYLLASWGVNGAINPLHYIRNARMHIQVLDVQEHPDGLLIQLPQDGDTAGNRFLSFRIAASKNFSFDLPLAAYLPQGEVQDASVRVWQGWNSLDLESLQGGSTWSRILVPQPAAEAEEVVLETACLSVYRKTDTRKMIYVFVSFLFLAAFWECVWWIKERYAESN